MCKAQVEMPKYRCHKVVHALKIKRVVNNEDGTITLFPEKDTVYAPINRSVTFMLKKDVEAPGYLVVYEGGYESWSPADVFEAGYSKV